MRKTILVSCVLVLLLAISSLCAYADSLTCKGGIVSTGDNGSLLLAKCGSPDSVESHIEEVVQQRDHNAAWTESNQNTSTDKRLHHEQHKLYITVETWTYNFGPDRLMRTVTLKSGQITEIRTGGYGYPKP